jgi:hypothetical protein
MLWRALQSPLRLKDGLLPRFPSLSTSISRTQIPIHAICVRRLHDQKAVDTEHAPPLVRHDTLLEGPQKAGQPLLQLDKTIKVAGLVRSIRKQKTVAFARIGDGSTLANIQAVFPDPQIAKEYVGSPQRA